MAFVWLIPKGGGQSGLHGTLAEPCGHWAEPATLVQHSFRRGLSFEECIPQGIVLCCVPGQRSLLRFVAEHHQ